MKEKIEYYVIVQSESGETTEFIATSSSQKYAIMVAKALVSSNEFQFNDAFSMFANNGPISANVSVIESTQNEQVWPETEAS